MESLEYYLNSLNPFKDIDFTILWGWLPADFQSTLAGIAAVVIVLAVIGLVRKYIPVS